MLLPHAATVRRATASAGPASTLVPLRQHQRMLQQQREQKESQLIADDVPPPLPPRDANDEVVDGEDYDCKAYTVILLC